LSQSVNRKGKIKTYFIVKSGCPLDRNFFRPVSGSQNKEYSAPIAEDGKRLVGELQRRVVISTANRTHGLGTLKDSDDFRCPTFTAAIRNLKTE
jgi:hypothetical protein